jgi:hypothetical protein
VPCRDHDRADDQRGPGERGGPWPLVEDHGSERDGHERVHVLVGHDL